MKPPTIPGFEIIDRLGTGGMATVWRARQVSLDRTVAIKVLSAQYAHEPTDIERFQKEAQSAARLKHIGIVQVYDANAQQGLYYFVMEYVAGYTVGDWVRRREKLSEEDALLVADCVADALGYAWHSAGIIHCDIKPDNVIIDADGTVKVADLGLARTISAMSSAEPSDEVMGTPAYISPEQATGVPDLDCRADIYSLGAMLYHLVTGTMLFEGNPEGRVMDMQVGDCVADACDLCPSVSLPMCWLIERMLAKHRNHRQPDWDSVRRDIERVRKGWSPVAHLPVTAKSTMKRSLRRTIQTYRKSQPPGERHMGASARVAAFFAAVAVGGALGFGGWYLLRDGGKSSWMGRVTTTTQARVTTTTQPAVVKPPEQTLFEQAALFARGNPGDFDGAMDRFRKVLEMAPDESEWAVSAEREIARLDGEKDKAVADLLARLRSEALEKLVNGSFKDAISHISDYKGPLAEATREQRDAQLAELRKEIERRRQLREQMRNRASEGLSKLVGEVTDAMLDEGMLDALVHLRGGATLELRKADRDGILEELEAALQKAAKVELMAMQSFAAQAGSTIDVSLSDGSRKLTIAKVEQGRVYASEPGSSDLTISLGFDDLASREQLMRLGRLTDPDVCLVKASVAAQSHAYSHARRYLAESDSILGEMMLKAVMGRETQSRNEDARRALARLLRQAGVAAVPDYDLNAWTQVARSAPVSEDNRDLVREAVDRFNLIHGNTGFAKECQPVLDALTQHL